MSDTFAQEQVKQFTDNILSNVTWETESRKKLVGANEGDKARASLCRRFEEAITLAERRIKTGADPLAQLASMRLWLSKVLYSCNRDNYRKPQEDRPLVNLAPPWMYQVGRFRGPKP